MTSLVAVITNVHEHSKGNKYGIWLLDHEGRGINEVLVNEGFAKFIDTDENLNQIIDKVEDKPEEEKVMASVLTLHDEVMDSEDSSSAKVHSILMRSYKLYEQFKHDNAD